MNHTDTIKDISIKLGQAPDLFLNESIRYYLERKLKEYEFELLSMKLKYQINTIEEFENLFFNGTVEESAAMDDFKKFDLFSYRIDEINEYLKQPS
ncbi:MAG: hypothetical protein HW421_2585 [Ignavibacteria bacterium]|nr:hypothetical protein [Ignavibacteria bacterium]